MNTSPSNFDEFDFEPSKTPSVHLMDYVLIVIQRLPVALAIALSILIAGIIYTWTRVPRYTASASLLFEPGQVNLTDMKGAIDPVSASINKREFIQTQVQLMKSRPVAESVIQRLNLLEQDEFRDARDAVTRFQSLIMATPERNTHLINVSIERMNRTEAQRMVNTLISAFMDDTRNRRLGVSEEGLMQLRKKEIDMRKKLNESTEALQAFMIENDMVSFERTQNVVMNRLMDLTRQLNALQPQRMRLQARVEAANRALESGESISVLPDVIDAPIIRTLKLQLSDLANEYSQMVERLGANHPNLQSKTTQIQALQTKMSLEAEAILKSINMQYQQALEEESLLAQAIKDQEQEVYRFNRLASEYENLKRVRDSIEGPYSTISRRIEEIDINRIGGQGEHIFIISRASLPAYPSWPSKRKNLLITLLLAVALSVGTCFFLDYMDTTIKGEADVRRLLGSKVLAGIPNVKQPGEAQDHPDLASFENTRSHTAEAFRTLRTALAFSVPGERIRSVVVSSTLPAEGKSLCAVNIAITHAQTGKRTLLIDADLRKPRLHNVFSLNTEKGFSSLLDDEPLEVKDVIHPTVVDNLDVIPCGHIPRNPAELLDSESFRHHLESLQSRYEFIVFDSPPGFSLVDSLIIAKNTDGLILVINSFQTPKAAAEQFANRLYEANVRLLGVVLNTMDAPRTAAYYGSYYHAGSRRYSKYYREEHADAS